MNNKEDLSIDELSNIFCMETDELLGFLKSRDFNLKFEPGSKNGIITYEEVQKHLSSQYFI